MSKTLRECIGHEHKQDGVGSQAKYQISSGIFISFAQSFTEQERVHCFVDKVSYTERKNTDKVVECIYGSAADELDDILSHYNDLSSQELCEQLEGLLEKLKSGEVVLKDGN